MDDVNQLATDYNIQLRHVLDTHAPIRTKTIVARPCVPWFDHELKALKANRRKAEHRYRCCKTQESLMKFHEARNIYVNSLNIKRTYHLSHLVSEARGNTKNLFTLVNSLCDKMKSNPLPTHDSIESLANVFAFFFRDKIDAISNDIGDSEDPNVPSMVGDAAYLDAFNLVTEDEVRRMVTKSKTTSSAHDPIPTKIIKEYIEDLLPLITHIISCSLVSGTFPDEWKMALVVPLLKKRGLDPVPNNYRPVSNLQFISKLTEKAVIK